MKQLLLFLLLLPGLLHAQVDPQYMEGAVPLENGKVVFSKSFKAAGMTQDAIFSKLIYWAGNRFVPVEKDAMQSRVLYSDPNSGQIACLGQEYLVFTDKALALDRATINYQLAIECQAGSYQMKISEIRYLYSNGDKKEIIPAEEQITDEYTFTKKKDKLIKATGKFRIHTIDLVNQLYADAEKAVGASQTTTPAIVQTDERQNVTQTTTPQVATIATAINTESDNSSLNGYRQIAPDKIPGNIYKMLSENWMLITAGNDAGFNMMTASWGALGHLYNKPVAFCFINPTRHTIKYMDNSDTYTLSFYTETYRDVLNYCGSHSGKDTDKVAGSGLTPLTTPTGSKAFSEAWMIIECRKMVAQPFNPEAIFNPEAKDKWGKTPHKMFIGEIINVWVK